MELQLDDRLALVTASSDGIGKETATCLAREAATAIVNGRIAANAESAIAHIRARLPGAKLENLGSYEAFGFFEETDEAWLCTANTIMPGPTRTENVARFVQDTFLDLLSEEAERQFMPENRTTSLLEPVF